MIESDAENLELVETPASVDAVNAQFYGRFPFPWRPITFSCVSNDSFEVALLNQDVGDYTHRTVPGNSTVWVAGCGTNQAVYTALRFPRSTIVGSDLSATSLDLCHDTAHSLNIRNLELRRESLNEAPYKNLFDYVVCTGVVHHNAQPEMALARLAVALKPNGILELMVYNRYHRTPTTAFQKAVRMLGGAGGAADFDSELEIATRIVNAVPENSPMATWLKGYKGATEAAVADALMQPVEYSYTVRSLEELTAACGLEMVQPCINQFDKAAGRISWHMRFADETLQALYDSLPDTRRWQVTNLLMLEKSPMLWFYFRRRGEENQGMAEAKVCDAFLDATFSRSHTTRYTYRRSAGDTYRRSPIAVAYPPAPEDRDIAQVIAVADGKTRMRDIFTRLGIAQDLHTTNWTRLRCSTSAFPHLIAVV